MFDDSNSTGVEILTIGDELLRGDLADTNSSWLASQLFGLGLSVSRISSVGDAERDIVDALSAAIGRSRLLIVSGGLGPTDDDRTIAALSTVAGAPLCRHDGALEHVAKLFRRADLALTPNNEKQAWIPEGADALINERGTAPGVSLALGGCQVFCLPGVPRELRWLFENHLAPWIGAELGCRPAERRTLKFFGIGESQVDHRLVGLLEAVELQGCAASLHYRATFPENHLTILVRPAAEGEAAAVASAAVGVADSLANEAARRLEQYLFTRTDGQSFAAAIVGALAGAGATVALAESCTGGLASDLLTNASGSSEVFELGVVAYANRVKEKTLSVSSEILATDGAVSPACVEAMAKGVRELAGATYGVAISGIAGPGGGSEDKPVGTVHFAVASEAGVRLLHRCFPYDRRRNKQLAAYVALWLVLRQVRSAAQPDATDGDATDRGAATGTDDDPLAGRWSGASRRED